MINSTPSISVLIVAIAVTLCLSSDILAQSPVVDIKIVNINNLDLLIDDLANRNEPPRIVEHLYIDNPENESLIGVSNLPLFSDKYDWAEQRRVFNACKILVKRNGADLWPFLVEHIGDKRYTFTCTLDDFGKNITIGSICWQIAYGDLINPFSHFWPSKTEIRGAISWGGRSYIPPPYHDLKGWCDARQGKPLWELQVELGQWGIQSLEDLKEMPNEEKTDLIRKIKATIEVLQQDKKPIVDNRQPLFFDQARYFDARKAEEIREEYRIRICIGAEPKPESALEQKEPRYLEKTLNEWITLTKHKDVKIRAYATRALGALEPDATSAVPALTQLLKDRESPVRRAAALALEKMGPDAKAAVPALTELLKDNNLPVRQAAINALENINSDAKAAVP
jgi:hypothetical protein